MTEKDTNPKDAIGTAKWRQFMVVPRQVMWEVGVGMLEGALKYGRHNYRGAGVRASVYCDAALGHIEQFIEGEDVDADSGLSHVTKAICSLVVLRDAMMNDFWNDDRPPKIKDLDALRKRLQAKVAENFERYADKNPHHYTDEEDGAPYRGARVDDRYVADMTADELRVALHQREKMEAMAAVWSREFHEAHEKEKEFLGSMQDIRIGGQVFNPDVWNADEDSFIDEAILTTASERMAQRELLAASVNGMDDEQPIAGLYPQQIALLEEWREAEDGATFAHDVPAVAKAIALLQWAKHRGLL